MIQWLYYLLQLPFYVAARWIPSQKNLWVFGAWQGDRYADNSRYVYEYILEHHPEIRAIWFTARHSVYWALRKQNKPVVRINSLKGLWLAMRAHVAVVTHSLRADIQPLIHPAKTLTVQLWHGIPLKKIGFDDTKFTNPLRPPGIQQLKQRLIKTLFPFWEERYAIICTTSPKLKHIFTSAFRHPPENIEITGYPRNDQLFHPVPFNRISTTEQAIIYMPTFRGGMGQSPDLFTPFEFNLMEISQVLEEYNARLFLRLHPVNLPPSHLKKAIDQSTRIHFFTEDDIYPYLAHFKVLITDFSSIYFDYLLLNRPIIFAPFDFETYLKQDRELYFDYHAVTPGPKAYNWHQVLYHLKSILKGEDPYREDRERIRNQFHTYLDDQSTERVTHAIFNRL